MPVPNLGEFDTAINGLFRLRPADFVPQSVWFGLQLGETVFMAHLRDDAGRQMHVVRPLALETSAGFSFSSEQADGIHSDPRGAEFMRGGYLHRHVDDGGDLVFAGQGGAWSGASPQRYEMRLGDQVVWRDSGLLDLEGRLMGPGTQLYIPWRDQDAGGGMLHTGLFYHAEGTLFGEHVEGIVIVDHIYSPLGRTLHGSPLRNRYIGAWNAFATVFEDGSVQYGQFGYGAGPFRYANIVDGDRHIVCAVESATPQYDDAGLATRLDYRLANGNDWHWQIDPRGTLQTMTRAAAAQGSNCQVHKGHVRRAGDDRASRTHYAIIEWFPDRIVAEPSDAEIVIPAGF